MAVDYGREMSCTDTLKTGRFVTGARLVGEACYRRLTTPRGMLKGGEEEANYGLDLTELVGTVDKKLAATIPGRIKNELKKDERIETVDVTVLETTSAGAKSFQITIVVGLADGPTFTLRLLASAVTVQLLGIDTEDT